MKERVTLTSEVGAKLLPTSIAVDQGGTARTGENQLGSGLYTYNLASCIGVVFHGKEKEKNKFTLMHLDSFQDLFSQLKIEFNHFENPPEVTLIANRQGCFTDLITLGSYRAQDDGYEISLETRERLSFLFDEMIQRNLSKTNMELMANTFKCSEKELEIMLAQMKDNDDVCVDFVADILEQNAKIRAILSHLNVNEAQLLTSPTGSVMVDANHIYIDEDEVISDFIYEGNQNKFKENAQDVVEKENDNESELFLLSIFKDSKKRKNDSENLLNTLETPTKIQCLTSPSQSNQSKE